LTWCREATVVRREFLTGLLARRTPPKGTAGYLAGELAYGNSALRRAMERAHELAALLLGVDTSHSRQSIAALTQTATDARAQVISLGLVLGAVEESTDTQTWREPTDTAKRYFAFLAASGYVLAEVEQFAAGNPKKPTRRSRHDHALSTPTADESDSSRNEDAPIDQPSDLSPEAGTGGEAAA
jgi:ParB family transcriptional regulator, chromosome partitioning protein